MRVTWVYSYTAEIFILQIIFNISLSNIKKMRVLSLKRNLKKRRGILFHKLTRGFIFVTFSE